MSAAKPYTELNDLERAMREVLASSLTEINVDGDSVEFDLASTIGAQVGQERCEVIYGRCPVPFDKMEALVMQQWQTVATPNSLLLN